MLVRRAEVSDAPAIAALHAASWRRVYHGALSAAYLAGDVVAERRALWDQRLAAPPPGMLTVVAERAGEMAGFACALANGGPPWGSLLDNLHVASAFQGQGLGRRLLGEAAMWCRMVATQPGLLLSVLQSNRPAQRFYERLGGVKVGSQDWTPPGGGTVPCFLYAWHGSAWTSLADH